MPIYPLMSILSKIIILEFITFCLSPVSADSKDPLNRTFSYHFSGSSASCGSTVTSGENIISEKYKAPPFRKDCQPSDASYDCCDFSPSTNPKMTNDYLKRFDFTKKPAQGASFRGSDLSGLNLSRGNFAGSQFDGTRLNGTNLERADLRGSEIKNSRFQGANLTNAELGHFCYEQNDNKDCDKYKIVTISGSAFDGAVMIGTQLTKTEIDHSSFRGATLLFNRPPYLVSDSQFEHALIDRFWDSVRMERTDISKAKYLDNDDQPIPEQERLEKGLKQCETYKDGMEASESKSFLDLMSDPAICWDLDKQIELYCGLWKLKESLNAYSRSQDGYGLKACFRAEQKQLFEERAQITSAFSLNKKQENRLEAIQKRLDELSSQTTSSRDKRLFQSISRLTGGDVPSSSKEAYRGERKLEGLAKLIARRTDGLRRSSAQIRELKKELDGAEKTYYEKLNGPKEGSNTGYVWVNGQPQFEKKYQEALDSARQKYQSSLEQAASNNLEIQNKILSECEEAKPAFASFITEFSNWEYELLGHKSEAVFAELKKLGAKAEQPLACAVVVGEKSDSKKSDPASGARRSSGTTGEAVR